MVETSVVIINRTDTGLNKAVFIQLYNEGDVHHYCIQLMVPLKFKCKKDAIHYFKHTFEKLAEEMQIELSK